MNKTALSVENLTKIYSKNKDDRYIFLESILAAEEIFYVSYVGENANQNLSSVSKWDTRNNSKLFNVYMNGGTHIATYAQTAIEMASTLPTDQKIALFITDGYCSSVSYLESLRQQALAKGITLVGVGIGDVGELEERFRTVNKVQYQYGVLSYFRCMSLSPRLRYLICNKAT